MYEMRPAHRGADYARRPFGRFPLGFVPFMVFLGSMELASSGPYFPVFLLIPLLLLFEFFVAPAMRRSAVRTSCARVAEVVPAYVGQPCAAEQGLEVPVHDILSV